MEWGLNAESICIYRWVIGVGTICHDASSSAPCPVAAIPENGLFYIVAAAHSFNSASSFQLMREIFAKTIQGNKAMNKSPKIC